MGGFERGEGKRARDSYSGVVSLAGTAQVAHCVECVGSYGSLHWPPAGAVELLRRVECTIDHARCRTAHRRTAGGQLAIERPSSRAPLLNCCCPASLPRSDRWAVLELERVG